MSVLQKLSDAGLLNTPTPTAAVTASPSPTPEALVDDSVQVEQVIETPTPTASPTSAAPVDNSTEVETAQAVDVNADGEIEDSRAAKVETVVETPFPSPSQSPTSSPSPEAPVDDSVQVEPVVETQFLTDKQAQDPEVQLPVCGSFKLEAKSGKLVPLQAVITDEELGDKHLKGKSFCHTWDIKVDDISKQYSICTQKEDFLSKVVGRCSSGDDNAQITSECLFDFTQGEQCELVGENNAEAE